MRSGVIENNLVLGLENRPPFLVHGRDGDCNESPRVFLVGHGSQKLSPEVNDYNEVFLLRNFCQIEPRL